MENFKKHFHLYILSVLFLFNVFVWQAVFASEGRLLTVAFLDVGQGDAIFIESPSGNQILLDGGPDNSVLRELSKIMPFYDRSINTVIASHPDKDHIGGLPEALKRYQVDMIIEPGVSNDTAVYNEFEKLIKELSIEKNIARRGMRVWLDKNIYLEILFPDRDTDGWDTNDASIVARLVYGDTSFILSGDSPKKMEEYIVSLDGSALQSDVLKLGHHGSKTSTSGIFLSAVSPEYVIVSAGENNQYGHPHEEVMDIIKKFEIPSLSTYENGTIIFQTDGENLYIK